MTSQLLIFTLAFFLLLPAGGARLPAPPRAALRTVIVGGGPDKEHNQVAIESNVRYVRRLLPSSPTRVLWADGSTTTNTVLYSDADGNDRYRPTLVTGISGPLHLSALRRTLEQMGTGPHAPVLLYFTGHGSPADVGYDNNAFDMWDNEELSVRRTASLLSLLPPQTPVTVVMVQCYSGAFGNLLFAGGDPQGALLPRPLCGFFASLDSRTAAGCTSEVDETDYHDFTSYFFAALSKQTRTGRPLTSGADFNHDGTVGMNEAFAYTLLHDPSIDTPVCTSDVFLRRFFPSSDPDLFLKPYTLVRGWADPAQAAVLDGLSAQLHITGEKRLAQAYRIFAARSRRDPDTESEQQEEETARWTRFVRTAKTVMLTHALQMRGTADRKAQFAALKMREAENPLPPVTISAHSL